MKTFSLCQVIVSGSLFSLSVFGAVAQPSVKVETVDGQTVQVELAKLRKAYEEGIKANIGEGASGVFLNDDGSTTFMNPRFLHGGKRYPLGRNFSGTSDGDTWTSRGFCVLKGFEEDLNHSIGQIKPSEMTVMLDVKGKARHLEVYDEVFTQITCD